MNADVPQDVLDAADICAITQLVLLERECRDLARWDRMRECFYPDSHVRISWFSGSGAEFVDGSIKLVGRGMVAKHRLGPPLVRLAGHRAVVSLPAIIDIPDHVAGVEVMLASHARLMVRTEKRNGTWKIVFFDAIYVRDELTSVIPGQAIPITPDDVKSFRPSYRFLCFLLKQKGYPPNMDLPGDDRPDSVAAFNKEIYGWAGIDP